MRETFALFDKDGIGCIKVTQLGLLMQSLGQVISDTQVRQFLEEFNMQGSTMQGSTR